MKHCQVCSLDCDAQAHTCPACGEASWAPPAVFAGIDMGDGDSVSVAAPAKPSKRKADK